MRFFLLLLCLATTMAATAQTRTLVFPYFFFEQHVDVRAYAGKPYRVSTRLRVTPPPGDSANADADVFTLVEGQKKEYLGSSSIAAPALAKCRDGQWHAVSFSGKLPAAAAELTITGRVHLNGTFNFDDFGLEVETAKGRWQAVPLVNGNFDAAAADSASGFPNGWRPTYRVVGYTWRTVPAAAGGPGNRQLELTGQEVVEYGKNPAAGHTIAVNGSKLYYETYGTGEPLLLLHGNSQSIRFFNDQIPVLARHFQVIAVDTRAQGKSTTDGRELTYDLFADDMSALLTALHLPAANVVGWSDGGNTGLSMALRYPAQVRRLVTMGANLYADTTAVQASMLKQVRTDRRSLTLLVPFSAQVRRQRPLLTLLLNYPRLKPAQLAAIKAPVLVLAGEQDIIKEAHSRLIAASIPGAQLLLFPKLTHNAPQEDPALFNETVLAFLRGAAVPVPATAK